MTVPDDVVELVRADVERGLGQLYPARDADVAFSVPEPFSPERQLADSDRESVAVPWRWRGTFRQRVITQRDPVEIPVDVDGITIVRMEGAGAEQRPVFHRYVDWVGALSSLGFTLNSRPIIDFPDAADADPSEADSSQSS